MAGTQTAQPALTEEFVRCQGPWAWRRGRGKGRFWASGSWGCVSGVSFNLAHLFDSLCIPSSRLWQVGVWPQSPSQHGNLYSMGKAWQRTGILSTAPKAVERSWSVSHSPSHLRCMEKQTELSKDLTDLYKSALVVWPCTSCNGGGESMACMPQQAACITENS